MVDKLNQIKKLVEEILEEIEPKEPTDEQIEEILGSEFHHATEHFSKIVDEVLNQEINEAIKRQHRIRIHDELYKEIEEWRTLDYYPYFRMGDNEITCELIPQFHTPTHVTRPIIGTAKLKIKDHFDEQLGCLLAILFAGYDAPGEFEREIEKRDLQFVYSYL